MDYFKQERLCKQNFIDKIKYDWVIIKWWRKERLNLFVSNKIKI